MYQEYKSNRYPSNGNEPMDNRYYSRPFTPPYMPMMADIDCGCSMDFGPRPYVVNINEASKENDNYRTAIWTGTHLQVTLMSIEVGEDIGLEIHPNIDQFFRIEEGQGVVLMGRMKDRMDFQARVNDDYAIMVPAGTWHNIVNTGYRPLKLYSIYAPPKHPYGTVHPTKEDAQEASER